MARELENEAMKGINEKRGNSVFAKALTSLERIEGFRVPALERFKGDAKEQEVDEDTEEEDDNDTEEQEEDEEDDEEVEGDDHEVERVEEQIM